MPNPDRLNVLLITADQYRGDFLGLHGHPVVRTPNLDALGTAGAWFPNAYSPVPICVPARYAIMTGQVPIRFGVRGNSGGDPSGGRVMPEEVPTLPTVFGEAGYATAAIGKMHFSPWREPHGFQTFVVSEEGRQWKDAGGDAYQAYLREVGWGGYERSHAIGNNDVHTSASPLPLEHYHTTWCARTTRRWIQDHVSRAGVDGRRGGAGGDEKPFFAWCSFTKPHSPYDPPEPFDRLYDPRTFPPPIGGPEDLEGLSPAYEQNRRTHFWDTLGPEQIQRARAFYAGNVTLIDHMIGELVETLRTLGVADRTVICFTADHGDLLGDHGLFFKSNFFRGAWHVPFVLYAPGRLEGHGRTERFVATQDVYPTLLSLAGVPLPKGTIIDGQVLTEDLDGGPPTIFGSVGGGPSGRGPVPQGSSRRGPVRGTGSDGGAAIEGMVHGARGRRWSYAIHPHGAYEALYDLQADPDERHNLASTFRGGEEAHAALRDMRAQLEAWLATLGDTTALDDTGHLRLDPSAHGWEPAPAPRVGLGLRPY